MFLIILTLVVIYLFSRMYWSRLSLPPGPIPYPILGNFPQIGAGIKNGGLVATMKRWQQEYGPVHTVWIGRKPTVNICRFDLAYEAMVKKGALFSDRYVPFLMDVARNGLGVVVGNGAHGTEQRRFAIHTLKNFGIGKNIMEDRIMMEFDYRVAIIDKQLSASADGRLVIDPHKFLDVTVGNIINRILFTDRFTEEKEQLFYDLKENMRIVSENVSIFDLILEKWNSRLPFFKERLHALRQPQLDLKQFHMDNVQKRIDEIASGHHELRGDGEDLVDAYLIQMEKYQEKGVQQDFNLDTLASTLFDLWIAGQETTSNVLCWAFTFILNHPEVHTRLVDEIDSVAKDRMLTLNDRTSTPYLNATITETLRLSSIVPLNLWRECAEDMVIGGQMVKKGTAITAQLSVILQDGTSFPNPTEFNPSRFLDDKDRLDLQVVSFGMGKRACLGESLARAELYLIIGNLLGQYNISGSPDKPPKMEAMADRGTKRNSQPYDIVIQRRT